MNIPDTIQLLMETKTALLDAQLALGDVPACSPEYVARASCFVAHEALECAIRAMQAAPPEALR